MDNLDSQCQPEYLMSEESARPMIIRCMRCLPSLLTTALPSAPHATPPASQATFHCAAAHDAAPPARAACSPTQVPAGKTDQTQPVDDGLRRQIKIYMAKEEDEWLEDDTNLQKWESNELTASDRRILLAQWHCKAMKAAFVVL